MEIALRKYQLEDAKDLAILANNPEVSLNLRDTFPYPYQEADAVRFIQHAMKLPLYKGLEFVITVDGKFAGSLGATFQQDIYRKTCEIGYWLGAPYWGQGVMSAALEIFTTYLFEELEMHKIYAEIFSRNIGSQKVLEKNHFILEGILHEHALKHNVYQDLHIYSLLNTKN